MPAPVSVRTDFSAAELRRLAATTKNANQSRRLLSLAAVLEGMNRTDAARIGGIDRQHLIAERFGVAYHERTIGKILHQLGFSHISARPRHPAQDGQTVAAFKKNFPATLNSHLAGVATGKPIEICWHTT